MNNEVIELSILMPCLNEAETLAKCINKANNYLKLSNIAGEVIIADNGSTDGSQKIAASLGARVVSVSERGYGAALISGIKVAKGQYIIMGDSDDSYDFSSLDDFVDKLRQGFDLVMGNRFRGGIEPGAMPPLHRYLGNPVLSGIGRIFFSSRISDFHCGLRGFNKKAIDGLYLTSPGMEFASEMVVKATLAKLRVGEVPTVLSKDGRSRPPHLRSWRDGWRHLRFLLMHAPRWTFLYPGLALTAFGLLIYILVLPGPLRIGSIVFDVHTLLIGSLAMLVGSEILIFFILAKQYAISHGLLPEGQRFRAFRENATLERSVLLGALLFFLGFAGTGASVWTWSTASFGHLDYSHTMRLLIPSVTLLGGGIEIMLASFLSGIMDLGIINNPN